MRPPPYTITPATIRRTASNILQETLPWKACGRLVSGCRLLDLLLVGSSLSALVGLALLLRQVWVGLSGQVAADRELKPPQWVEALPLKRMLGWLQSKLRRRSKEEEVIHRGRPLPTRKPA